MIHILIRKQLNAPFSVLKPTAATLSNVVKMDAAMARPKCSGQHFDVRPNSI